MNTKRNLVHEHRKRGRPEDNAWCDFYKDLRYEPITMLEYHNGELVGHSVMGYEGYQFLGGRDPRFLAAPQ